MSGAPVRVVGWDADRDVLLAARQGEPSFRWVQDLGDAYLAAAERGVELHIPRSVYVAMIERGEAPAAPLSNVRIGDG